jgi:hypothetical protein
MRRSGKASSSRARWLAAAWAAAVSSLSCGSSGGRQGGAGGSAGFDAASDAVGDLTSRGDAVSGDGQVDVAGPTGCSPGQQLSSPPSAAACSGDVCVCDIYPYQSADGGTLVLAKHSVNVSDPDVESLHLPTPTTAGQPYTLSIDYVSSGYQGTVELWGTDSACGPGLEMLFSAPIAAKQLYCATLHPSAAYPELLLVYRYNNSVPSASSELPITACPSGGCP